MGMIVAGIDPSLRNTGVAVVELNEDRNAVQAIRALRLCATQAPKNKTQRKSSADYQSAVSVANQVQLMLNNWNIDLVFAEIPSGAQSARASWALGISLGLVASVQPTPIEVTAAQVKMASAGVRTATKDEMIDWAVAKYPDAPWMRMNNGRILKSNEHLADALAIIHAGIESAEFLTIRKMFS